MAILGKNKKPKAKPKLKILSIPNGESFILKEEVPFQSKPIWTKHHYQHQDFLSALLGRSHFSACLYWHENNLTPWYVRFKHSMITILFLVDIY